MNRTVTLPFNMTFVPFIWAHISCSVYGYRFVCRRLKALGQNNVLTKLKVVITQRTKTNRQTTTTSHTTERNLTDKWKTSKRKRRRNSQEIWQEEEEERREEEEEQSIRFSGGQVVFFRISSKPIILTKGETHTHFGACIPPPPPIPPLPPTPAAFSPADAEAFRTSRYCISAAAALE